MKGGRKTEYQKKTPDDELLKLSRTKPEIIAPTETRTPLFALGQARKADVQTITPRVAFSIGGRLGKQTC